MESYKKKILKFTIIGLMFVVMILTTNELHAANKKQLEAGRISLPKTSYTYTGKEIKPKPTVKHKGLLFTTTLKEGTDYTVSYRYNTKVTSEHYNNAAEVVIKGKGDYTGIVTKYFTIKPIDIKYCTISLSSNIYTYNSKAKKPTVKLYKGSNLISSSNYSVNYEDNVAAGTALVVVKGCGNLTGTKLQTFKIEKRHISTANVTLSKDTYEFDGTERKPSIKSIKIWTGSEYKTVSSNYYTIKYKDNKNPGTAYVTLTGKGNFTGAVNIPFTINKGDIYNTKVNLSQKEFEYDSTEKKPKVTSVQLKNSKGKLVTVPKKYYDVSYKNYINPGTASVIIKGKEKFKGTKTVEYTINKRDINTASVTLKQSAFTYDGTSKKPSIDSIKITTSDGEKKVKSTYYEIVKYGNNTNAGKGYVKIKGKGKFTGEKTVTFTIKPRPLSSGGITIEEKKGWRNNGDIIIEKVVYTNGKKQIVLNEGVDYKLTKKSITYSSDRLEKDGMIDSRWSYTIKGLGNFCDKYTSGAVGATEILDISSHMLSDTAGYSWNYNYINEQLNGRLDEYLVDINNNINIIIENKEFSTWDSAREVMISMPFTIRYNNPYNNEIYTLIPEINFTYQKKGNKYIITGINRYKGTMTITVE